MKSRLYKPEEYDKLKPWWVNHWGHAPSANLVPSSGLIVGDEHDDLAAGWLYMDMTTTVSFIAWLVVNPINTISETRDSLKALIDGLETLAKSQGRSAIITLLPSGGFSKLLQRQGYRATDINMEHLVKELS